MVHAQKICKVGTFALHFVELYFSNFFAFYLILGVNILIPSIECVILCLR